MKLLKFLLLIIPFISCKEEPVPKDSANINQEITIISNNESGKYPVVVRRLNSIKYREGDKKFLHDLSDTLTMKINPTDLILISSQTTIKDTIKVNRGDTIVLSYKDDVITYNSDIKKNPFTTKKKSRFTISDQIDKVYNTIFMKDTLGIPMVINNKYEKIILNPTSIRLRPNTDLRLLETLDSLNYELYLKKSDSFRMNLEKNLIDKPEFDLYNSKWLFDYYSSLSFLYQKSKSDKLKSKLLSNKFINDSLINNPFHFGIFHKYLNTLQESKSTNPKKKKRFSEIYYALKDNLEGNLLKYSQLICLDKMISWKEPFEEILKCYDDYIEHYGDDVFIQAFDEQNLLRLRKMHDAKEDLVLYDTVGNNLSFTELINKNKGKIIYVDFWASWCAPCIQQFPASKELSESLEDKVVFIYLSIDANHSDWINSSHELNLEKYNNYLVLNYEQSNFRRDLEINSIPRYLIYDKRGNLKNQNAPTPSDKSTFSLLSDLYEK